MRAIKSNEVMSMGPQSHPSLAEREGAGVLLGDRFNLRRTWHRALRHRSKGYPAGFPQSRIEILMKTPQLRPPAGQ
jgi:hypothetical protein